MVSSRDDAFVEQWGGFFFEKIFKIGCLKSPTKSGAFQKNIAQRRHRLNSQLSLWRQEAVTELVTRRQSSSSSNVYLQFSVVNSPSVCRRDTSRTPVQGFLWSSPSVKNEVVPISVILCTHTPYVANFGVSHVFCWGQHRDLNIIH